MDYVNAAAAVRRSSQLFVPEQLTQLYYTPVYRQLSCAQRQSYNQLYAAHTNEQFIFFEHSVGNAISRSLLPLLESNECRALRERLDEMVQQEEAHQSMFETLNREVFPHWYESRAYYFIEPSKQALWVLNSLTRLSRSLQFLIWFAFFLEEASVAFSRTVLREAKVEGMLDHRFLEVHRRHLRDEVQHVRLYPDLIRAIIGQSSRPSRRLNGIALKYAMREFLAPKRSGIAVLREWVKQHPELLAHQREMEHAIRGLKHSKVFFDAFFGPAQLPVIHELWQEFPEFAWHGYQGD